MSLWKKKDRKRLRDSNNRSSRLVKRPLAFEPLEGRMMMSANVYGNADPRYGVNCTPGTVVYDLTHHAAYVCQQSRSTCVQQAMGLGNEAATENWPFLGLVGKILGYVNAYQCQSRK